MERLGLVSVLRVQRLGLESLNQLVFLNCDTAVSIRFLERLGLVSVLKVDRLGHVSVL